MKITLIAEIEVDTDKVNCEESLSIIKNALPIYCEVKSLKYKRKEKE